MYCSNCGNKINDNDKYCSSCGNELANIEHTNKFVDESVVNNQKIETKFDNDEFDVFTEKIICFLRRIKELIVEHKIIFGLCVASFIIICYSLFWTSTVNQAKNLASQGEYVKAQAKVASLFNPFHNKEIEKIQYFGKITAPKEQIKIIKENPSLDNEWDYYLILQNLFEGIRIIEETPLPENVEPQDVLYTYYFLELVDYIDDVYATDVSKLKELDEENLNKHIKQIAKNIVAQNQIDAAEENLKLKLDAQKIKVIPGCNYSDDKWVCQCFVRVAKDSPYKYYKEFKITVNYYDENYNIVQTDSYEFDQIHRNYYKTIEIVSIPTSKTRPFKHSISVDYLYAY